MVSSQLASPLPDERLSDSRRPPDKTGLTGIEGRLFPLHTLVFSCVGSESVPLARSVAIYEMDRRKKKVTSIGKKKKGDVVYFLRPIKLVILGILR